MRYTCGEEGPSPTFKVAKGSQPGASVLSNRQWMKRYVEEFRVKAARMTGDIHFVTFSSEKCRQFKTIDAEGGFLLTAELSLRAWEWPFATPSTVAQAAEYLGIDPKDIVAC